MTGTQTSPGSTWNFSNLGIGGFELWGVGTSGDLETGWQTSAGSAWTWATIGNSGWQGSVAVEPVSAGGLSTGGFQLWGVATSGNLVTGTQTSPGSTWNFSNLGIDWQGSVAVEPVNAGGLSTGGFELWGVGTSGDLETGWQTSAGSAWTWAPIGNSGWQ